MKKSFVSILAIWCCTAAFAVTAKGHSGNRSEFKIPFEFRIKDKTFPAGKYSINRLDPANPDILILEEIGGKRKLIFHATRVNGERPTASARLTFDRDDKNCFLTGVWELGEKYGYQILSKDGE